MFEGAIISANPLTPGAGIPMAVAGAAAIAAGLTMGGTGLAMQENAGTSIAKASARGAAIDERREAVGTGERGFGRRSKQTGGGTEDRGPLQIVNVWGVDGPQAEDQARRTVRSLRTAERRRIRR